MKHRRDKREQENKREKKMKKLITNFCNKDTQ